MSRTIAWVSGSFLIMALTVFASYQYSTLNKKEGVIKTQHTEIVRLDDDLFKETQLRMAAETKVMDLEGKIIELRDSVALLQDNIVSLKRKVRKQEKTLRALSKKLKSFENDYDILKQEIAALSRKETIDMERIQELELEKETLRNEIATVEIKREREEEKQQKVEASLLEQKMKEERLRQITKIIDNTRVVYQTVSTQKKRFGKTMKKLKRKNTAWAYTVLEFKLIHDEHQLLLDEKFIAKIIDSDTGEVLSYIENNPNFPDSDKDAKGIKFKFDGNLIELAHYNNQEKTGENYEVQLFYIDSEGQEHMLRGGKKQFLKNRRLVR
ncbi:MAG: hypothetical protein AB8F74_07895 [Saprospiraceae bacterium]